jgi:hypothetical protein
VLALQVSSASSSDWSSVHVSPAVLHTKDETSGQAVWYEKQVSPLCTVNASPLQGMDDGSPGGCGDGDPVHALHVSSANSTDRSAVHVSPAVSHTKQETSGQAVWYEKQVSPLCTVNASPSQGMDDGCAADAARMGRQDRALRMKPMMPKNANFN